MKHILFLSTVVTTITAFNMDNIQILQNLGYSVHVAADFGSSNPVSAEKLAAIKADFENRGIIYHQIDFTRSAFALNAHIKAYKQLLSLMTENQFDFIHCHTPIASAISRLAAHKKKIKVIYTAHGFHFYKGAPLKNWLIYYPMEKILSKYTDILITINSEDRAYSEKKLKAKRIEYIPSVGIHCERFEKSERSKECIRAELGIPEDAILLFSVGELNANKNHTVIIDAMARLKIQNLYFVVAGIGNKKQELEEKAEKLGLKNNIKLLGFRSDINDLLHSADIFVFPSYREGMPVSPLEAMAAGLPIVASYIRGVKDFAEEGKTGFTCSPDDPTEWAEKIKQLIDDENLRKQISEYNKKIVQKFDIENVNSIMKSIYQSV